MEAFKAIKNVLVVGAINKDKDCPRKTGHIFTVFICSNWNNFFSELRKRHTQYPLVSFLGPCPLFSSLGVDFLLRVFGYSNMTVWPQNRSFLEQSFSVGFFHAALSDSGLGVRMGRGWRGKWFSPLASFQGIILSYLNLTETL